MKIPGPPINKSFLVLATLIIGVLLFISFIGAFALEDAKTGKSDFTGTILAGLFHVMRFPTHTLCWSYISRSGMFIYWAGLFINCLFYGFVIERVYSVIRFLITPKRK